MTKFGIKLADGRSLIVNGNTLDHLTQPTHFVPFCPELLQYKTELIPQTELVSPIVLLGADYYYDVEPMPIQKLPSGYSLISTLLGPIVAGKPMGFLPNYRLILPIFVQRNPFRHHRKIFILLKVLASLMNLLLKMMTKSFRI